MPRAPWLLLMTLGLSGVAAAQAQELFAHGKEPVYTEEKIDRQFLRTRFGRALSTGNADPSCAQLLGGMLALLGEAAPRLHKRDQSFYVDPGLLSALTDQLATPAFPAQAYFGEMVRRVLIDGRMPAEWLQVATEINPSVRIIDLAKLKYLADGPMLIDSFYLTLPVLLERYRVEVLQANSTAARTALKAFREDYLDHEVAWGGLALVDVLGHGGRRRPRAGSAPGADPATEALLEEPQAKPQGPVIPFLQQPKREPPRRIRVKLLPRQYVELAKLPRGSRVLVRGRLFDFNRGMTQLELRDGLLFEDRDFSQGAVLAEPGAAARCALAQNDLTGVQGSQPGGFGQH